MHVPAGIATRELSSSSTSKPIVAGIDQIDSFFNGVSFKQNYQAVVLAPQCEGSVTSPIAPGGGITYSGIQPCESQAASTSSTAVATNSWVSGKYLTGISSLGAIGTPAHNVP